MATNTGARDPAVSRERFSFVDLLSKRGNENRSSFDISFEVVHIHDIRRKLAIYIFLNHWN